MKLVVTDKQFIVKDNTVKCIITIKTKFNHFETNDTKSKFSGIAICKSEDKFSFETGSKVALAKAENAAYKYFTKINKMLAEQYLNAVQELKEFIDKADSCIKHNIEYMKKF